MTLDEYLKHRYPNRGVSAQSQIFAKKIGVSRQSVDRYRTFERIPDLQRAYMICAATKFEVDPFELLSSDMMRATEAEIRNLV